MKIGATSSLEKLDRLEALGYDQIELSVAYVSTLDSDGVRDLKNTFSGKRISLRSCNCMFPGTIAPLYQDENLTQTRAYLEDVMPKLAELRVKTAVFGSGSFRRMPEEIPQEKRRLLIRDVLVLMESIARANDVMVVIEPLNTSETNVLNTTKEAMEYIRELELPNLKLLIDLYHFYRENEPLERIYEYGPYIRHIHIAEPTRRDFMRQCDEYDYASFFKTLKEIGYQGAVIFEGGKGDFDVGIEETYPVLRRFCNE